VRAMGAGARSHIVGPPPRAVGVNRGQELMRNQLVADGPSG